MRILTLENKTFELNHLPDSVEETVRFAVLDNSNPADPDFFFNPLIFLESFNSPAIVLEINGHEITMPLDWCIAVGCSEAGSDLEILPLTSLNDRGFEAFLFNPLTGSYPQFGKIEILNDLILRLEPFKDEDSGDKISNSTILENAKSEKNTYSHLLAEL